MKRILVSSLLLGIALSMSGCVLLRTINFVRGPKTVVVEPTKMVFKGIRKNELLFEMPLSLHNDTAGEARVKRVEVHAGVAGEQVFSTVLNDELVIGPDEKHILAIPMAIDVTRLTKGLAKKSMEITFSGNATVNLGLLGDREIDFSHKRTLFSPEGPHLKLESIVLKKKGLSLKAVKLIFQKIPHPDDKIIRSALTGTLKINGISVGKVDHMSTRSHKGNFEVEVSVEQGAALRIAKSVAKTGKWKSNTDVLYEAESKGMNYRIPYKFERDLNLLPWKKE